MGMKILKNTIVKSMLIACFFFPYFLLAQNDADLLRYSSINFGSTARSLSMGGAFGAVGADFSAFSNNPAGIAIYRKSEFSISPIVNNRVTDSEFLGSTNHYSKAPFGLGNLGIVYSYPKQRERNWKTINFGFGYNRLNTFKQEFGGSGANKSSSFLDGFLANANSGSGTHPNNLTDLPDGAYLAYNTFLIDPIPPDSLTYFSAIPNGGIQQDFNITSKGSFGEITFGMGANYQNKLHLGLSLAFPTFNYTRDLTWTETDVADTVNGPLSVYNFKSFNYNQVLESSGSGFNAKFGLIYKITDNIRLGAYIHTPTWYEVSDEAFNTLVAAFDSSVSFAEESQRLFDYTMRTPYKAGGSAAYLFNKKGLISIDYEFVDYASMKLNSDFYSFNAENDLVSEKYQGASNIRIGGEYRYNVFSFRGGYALYGSPFNSEFTSGEFNFEKTSYTAGVGYRNNKFFLDLGYAYSEWGEYYLPYTSVTNVVEGVTNEFTEHRIMLSFGTKF